MFYLDLDELQKVTSKLKWFSLNRRNLFSFRDKDHLQAGKISTKENILEFIRSKGIVVEQPRITLMTNVATLGYVFNPISFYFCFDQSNKPVCAVAEVRNTHGEMKLYLLAKDCLEEDTFRLRITKHFYVSPFSELDTEFEFIFKLPGDNVIFRVDDYKNGSRILMSRLVGQRRELTDANLLRYSLRFPLIPVKIITLIYWQALILRLKGLPFWRKNENQHLQKDIVKPILSK